MEDLGRTIAIQCIFPPQAWASGCAALGRDFTDCQDRFGEIVVAAGAAAYLPTDGTNVPDYLLAADDSGTEMQVCYGLLCEGPLPRFIRFSASPEVGRVSLSSLVRACLDFAETDRIGFVLLADTAGLMGAALRRSPSSELAGGTPFVFPGVAIGLASPLNVPTCTQPHWSSAWRVRGEPGPLAEPLVRRLGPKRRCKGTATRQPFPIGPCRAAKSS